MTDGHTEVSSPTAAASSTYDSTPGAVTRGGLWSLGGQAVGLAAGLIATPFTIRLLGSARYGVWSLLQTSLSWVGLADLGMSAASTRYGGESLARGDAEGEATAVWTAAAITVSLTTCAAVGAALAVRPILSDLLHVRGALLGPAAIALRIVCVAWVAQAISGTFNTPQQVRLRWRSYTIVTQGSAVLQLVAIPIALAAVAGGVVTAATIALAAAVAAAVGTVWVAARLQPAILRPRVDRPVAKRLLRYGGPLTVSGLADIPLSTAERLLLAHYTSTITVAYYVVASRLATLLSAIPGAVIGPLFPALVTLEQSGKNESARSLYKQTLQGAFLILTPAALLLAFVAHPFLALWAGQAYGRHSAVPFYVLLVGVWFNSLAWIPASYLIASGRTGLIARIHMLELAPYVVIGAVLTSTLGALGAAIVWSARVIVDSAVFFWSASRAGQLPRSPLSNRPLASILAPATLAAVLGLFSLLTSGLVARIGCAVVLSLGYCGLVWFVVLTPHERVGLSTLAAEVTPIARKRRSRS
jgi:O-antigen/teichoic acid export membrane protein